MGAERATFEVEDTVLLGFTKTVTVVVGRAEVVTVSTS